MCQLRVGPVFYCMRVGCCLQNSQALRQTLISGETERVPKGGSNSEAWGQINGILHPQVDNKREGRGIKHITVKVSTGETFGRGKGVNRSLNQDIVANRQIYNWLEWSMG